MSTEITRYKVPQMHELVESEQTELAKVNDLAVLLNQPPPAQFISQHPAITVKNEQGKYVPLAYLSIDKVEYLLTRIFVEWHVEIKLVQLIANSVCVTVRLHYYNPVTERWAFSDGVGASPLQTKSGAGAIDFNQMQSAAVQMAAPAAESYAVKDAAEKLGRLFGKDLNRKAIVSYDNLAGRFSQFKDISGEELQADPDNEAWQAMLNDCKTVEDLAKLYRQNQDALALEENAGIVVLFTERRKQLQNA